MNRILTFFGMSLFLVLFACSGQSEQKSEHQDTNIKELTAEKTYYYTCPMTEHKHVASKTAGNCSECGMKLVAAIEAESSSKEYYGCPMPSHSHIRHEESGKCEECSMDLKAMRLVSE